MSVSSRTSMGKPAARHLGVLAAAAVLLFPDLAQGQACVADPVTSMAELRAALLDPNCNPINIAAGTYMLTASGSGAMKIERDVTISAIGGGDVILDATGEAGAALFEMSGDFSLMLTGLILQGGTQNQGGAIRNTKGGATVTVRNSTIRDNSAGDRGGAVYNKGTFVCENSTLSGNSVGNNGGGGLQNDGGKAILTNCTVSGNSSVSVEGGGILNRGGGVLTLLNSTVANNQAPDGGGIFVDGGTVTLRNTLVADNTATAADDQIGGLPIASNGYNLVEGGCSGCQPGDLISDPLLGPLANNGGDTETHALLTGSPALNAALDTDAPATDQRGVARPQGPASDIGSYELQAIPQPVLSSAGNQTFWVGKARTAAGLMTVIEAGTAPSITTSNDIRIRIPAGFAMTWDTLDVAATIGGGAAAKVSPTVSYEDAGQTLSLNVTADFVVGDTVTIGGLSFLDFTAASGPDNLELEVDSAGTTAAEDDKTIEILAAGTPTISSELDQSFRVGDPPISISTITVRADASAPTITAANDIRIRIPFGFSMTWDTSDVTAQILGTGAAKVSSTVSYEDGGRTLVIDVLTDFDPGDVITISFLSFANFTAASLDDNLELEVGNDGQVSAVDDKVIFIVLILVTPDIHSSRDQFFTTGDPSTPIVAIRVTDDDDIPQITAANDIRIRIPASLDMVWDVTDVTAQIGARASNKVSSAVSYEDGGKTLVLDVITDFVARDWISVRGLSFTTFSSAGAPGRLELEAYNDGSTSSVDGYIKQILGSVISVDVWPDTTRASRLPSNGSDYAVDFTVSNLGSTTDSFDLLTSAAPGTAITVVSITGAGVTQGADPDSARLADLPAGEWATVTVTYSVGVVPAGTVDTLGFLARSVASPTQSDDGLLVFTLIRPSITISKVVNPSGTQAPGTDLTYTSTLTNAGTEEAVGVTSVSSIAPETEFKLGSVATSFPAGITVTVEFSDDDGSSWAYTPADQGCGAPAGYDGCVTDIRWTLQNPLSATAPDNVGTMGYVARIE